MPADTAAGPAACQTCVHACSHVPTCCMYSRSSLTHCSMYIVDREPSSLTHLRSTTTSSEAGKAGPGRAQGGGGLGFRARVRLMCCVRRAGRARPDTQPQDGKGAKPCRPSPSSHHPRGTHAMPRHARAPLPSSCRTRGSSECSSRMRASWRVRSSDSSLRSAGSPAQGSHKPRSQRQAGRAQRRGKDMTGAWQW